MTLDPKQLREFSEVVLAALSHDLEHPDITLPEGTEIRATQAPQAGVRVRLQLAGISMDVWEPVASRPPGYPDEVPFVPDTLVAVGPFADGRGYLLLYQHLADPDQVRSVVLDASRAAGWQRAEPFRLPGFSFSLDITLLTREDRSRAIMAGGRAGEGVVVVMDGFSNAKHDAV